MKRQVLAMILALSMVLPFAQMDMASATEKTTKENNVGDEKQLEDKWNPQNTKEDNDTTEYVSGDAIVVIEKTSGLTKSKVKGQIKTVAEDVKATECYEFSTNVVEQNTVKKTAKNATNGFYVQRIHSDTLSTAELIKEAQKMEGVLFAEPNYTVKVESVTDDAYSDAQWTLENKMQEAGTANCDINPEGVWGEEKSSDKEAVIAILDTGVDYTHEDLKDVMWENPYASLSGKYGYDFANNDSDPMDDHGHGSHCAGIIAAKANNKVGIAGVSQKGTKIMALKFIKGAGSGSTINAIGAYCYVMRAKKLGANVVAINNSWGGTKMVRSLKKVIDLASKEDIISVFSAGNNALDNDKNCKYPANYYNENVVSVGASDEGDNLASFTDYGAETVDIGAPGNNILSTVCTDTLNPSIYSQEDRKKLLSTYYGGESAGAISIPAITVDNKYGTDITEDIMSIDSNVYFGTVGKSIKFDFQNANVGDTFVITIPYFTGASEENLQGSFMFRRGGSKEANATDTNIVRATNTELLYSTQKKTVYQGTTNTLWAMPIGKDATIWNHTTFQAVSKESAKNNAIGGMVQFNVTITNKDNSCFYLDDFGISKENLPSKYFGKYEFYSGTSMAAPTVVGALAALYRSGDTSKEVLSKLYSCARKTESWKNKCRTGAVLDLSKVNERIPIIQQTMSDAKSTITLTGYNFGTTRGTIKINGTAIDGAKVISWSDNKVEFTAPEYIYQTVEIELQNSAEKKVSSQYSIQKTPNQLTYKSDLLDMSNSSINLASDGKNIYSFDEGTFRMIMEDGTSKKLGEVPSDLFDPYLDEYEVEKKETYLQRRLVYGDGALWTTIRIASPYRSTYYLVCYELESEIISATLIPDRVHYSVYSNLAFYNHAIYSLGGLDADKKASKETFKYDANAMDWTETAELPYAAGNGDSVINDGKLYYVPMLVDNAGKHTILCYDGNTWENLSCDLTYFDSQANNKSISVGTCKNKLILASDGAEGYGTVISYDLTEKKLKSTGYYMSRNMYQGIMDCVTSGDICYYVIKDEGDAIEKEVAGEVQEQCSRLYTMPVEGEEPLPTPTPVVTPTPVATQTPMATPTIAPSPTPTIVPSPTVAPTQAPTVKKGTKSKVVKITISSTTKKKHVRYGKKLKLKVSVYPKSAKNKSVVWSVNNKKYATITKNGIVKPKKKGIGKTIVIKARAKDGSKKYGTIRIKIRI